MARHHSLTVGVLQEMIKPLIVNNLIEARRWYADVKPQHVPLKVFVKGVAALVLSKSGHVLRRD